MNVRRIRYPKMIPLNNPILMRFTERILREFLETILTEIAEDSQEETKRFVLKKIG